MKAVAERALGAGEAAPKLVPEPSGEAERRQVTIMFSDLVGSTALSARMDPEDLREIVAAYQKCVAETVRRFGGFVAKYMGDGVLVYFGYPQAHEDDAERAVRAGLELIQSVGGLSPGYMRGSPLSIGGAEHLAKMSTLRMRPEAETGDDLVDGSHVVQSLTPAPAPSPWSRSSSRVAAGCGDL
jgi:Adenylate and Guanylate cyclase catalytic domain